MKIIFIFLCISFSAMVTFNAQTKIWYDVDDVLTTKEKAVYYRIFSNEKEGSHLVIDYYISGKKAKEAYFINGKKEGKSVAFYTTGEVKTTGAFANGLRDGMWKTYYSSGKMKQKGKYKMGIKVGVWKTFYKNN